MPNIASLHPQVVHFVVALLLLGVLARIVSIFGWPRWLNGAAAMLLLIGTGAAVVAVKSGTDAHGPVERIPGARPVVEEHEEAGELTRNVFLGVAALELLAIGLGWGGRRGGAVRIVHVASAAVGIFGAVQLYHAAEEGGELVYNHAGGPGLRSGDPADVQRLLLAGLYNQSQVDRREGRNADAASLIDEMARRFPNDTTIRFLRAESLMRDRHDYPAALAALDSIPVAPNDPRMAPRKATLEADIYLAMNQPDSARAALAPVVSAFPRNTRLKAKLDSIK